MFGWRSTTQDEFNAEKARLLKSQQLCEHGSSVAQTKPGLGVPGTIMASVVSPPPLQSGLDADAIAVADVSSPDLYSTHDGLFKMAGRDAVQVMDDLKAMQVWRHRIRLCACLCPRGELTNRTGHHPCVQELRCARRLLRLVREQELQRYYTRRPWRLPKHEDISHWPTQQLVSQHAFDPPPLLDQARHLPNPLLPPVS